MKKRVFWMIALLCLTVQGTRADACVDTELQLTTAIADGATIIKLNKDIGLSSYLNIEGITVTIDLNGHKLSHSGSNSAHIFWVHANDNNVCGHLTILDSSNDKKGSIEDGSATNGGGINVTFHTNSALKQLTGIEADNVTPSRIVLRFGDGESTSIENVTTPLAIRRGAGGEASWYSLDGRRLSGKPTGKGVYIHKGYKVVIK